MLFKVALKEGGRERERERLRLEYKIYKWDHMNDTMRNISTSNTVLVRYCSLKIYGYLFVFPCELL